MSLYDGNGYGTGASHHEQGPGQNEIDFRYNNPLLAAEDGATLRWVIKTVAQANGLVANFMPKPLKEEAGNGFHINMSTNSHMDEFMAGILNHIKEITLFLNPSETLMTVLVKIKRLNMFPGVTITALL